MRSPIGSMNNVKIFVLYLMRNINYPLDFNTINDIVMQSDYVMYLDFSDAFHEMLNGGLIENLGPGEKGDDLFAVTRKGAIVAEQLHSDILSSVLDKSLASALCYIDFRRRNITVDCSSERQMDQTFNVNIILKEGNKVILNTTVNVDSEYRALQIRRNFRDRPDVIFRGTLALLAGKVNYLFGEN